MTITVREANARGRGDHGWLKSFHSFSFADYHDAAHMGFGPLRVINEDRVQPGAGFGTHGHRDMEILSYVLEGALEHKDSMGNGSVIRPGDLQAISAGTGIRHSEFNPSASELVHFLQIWLLPDRANLKPGYSERSFSDADKRGRLKLVASADGREDSLLIHQNADIFATILDEGVKVSHRPAPGRKVWIQVARGAVEVNALALKAGDGAAIQDEAVVDITARAPNAELLVFDLP